MQEFAARFYKSKTWQMCRASYIKRVGGLCEKCLERGIYNPGEIVHHKIHLTPDNINNAAVTLNHDNLQLLCRTCHGEMHQQRVKRYTVDELGRVRAK